MTEAEWLEGVWWGVSDPWAAVQPTKRKWRLFALACLEPHRSHLWDAQLAGVLDTLARDAEGECSSDEVTHARATAESSFEQLTADASEQRWYYAQFEMVRAICEATQDIWERHAPVVAAGCEASARYRAGDREQERVMLAHRDALRDIFGIPFRPVALDPLWLTFDVLALARGIYEEKAFDRMPILADALQDAGCTNEDVLNHCRDANQTHVRGCWVLDLVLEKG